MFKRSPHPTPPNAKQAFVYPRHFAKVSYSSITIIHLFDLIIRLCKWWVDMRLQNIHGPAARWDANCVPSSTDQTSCIQPDSQVHGVPYTWVHLVHHVHLVHQVHSVNLGSRLSSTLENIEGLAARWDACVLSPAHRQISCPSCSFPAQFYALSSERTPLKALLNLLSDP